jgi:steroid delta-isomerase-like uncharacterized protein
LVLPPWHHAVMSATTTLDLLKRYYAAFNRGDNEEMLTLLSDGVIHDINQGGRETGKAAFRAFLSRMQTCYREQLIDLSYCVSHDGSRAAAEYVVLGTYEQADSGLPAASGQEYKLPGAAFFAVEGGQITRVTNYYNLSDWLRQVGAH